jgi:DNA-binding GntR family transcriptional regulator
MVKTTALPGLHEPLIGDGSAARRMEAALRQDILSMALAPGMRLSEQDLAQRYGLSRQPVREALIALAAAQLVEVQPQRGTVVSLLSVNKMMQARFVREAVEVAVVERACMAFDTACRAGLDELMALQVRAASRGDHDGFQHHDQRFHAMLAEGAGCPLAWHAIKDVKTHMDRVCTLTVLKPEAMTALAEQHAAIVQAIDARDARCAAAAIRHHMTQIVLALPAVQEAWPQYFEPTRVAAFSDGSP